MLEALKEEVFRANLLLPKYNLQGLNTKKLNIELVPVRKVEEAFRTLFG